MPTDWIAASDISADILDLGFGAKLLKKVCEYSAAGNVSFCLNIQVVHRMNLVGLIFERRCCCCQRLSHRFHWNEAENNVYTLNVPVAGAYTHVIWRNKDRNRTVVEWLHSAVLRWKPLIRLLPLQLFSLPRLIPLLIFQENGV